MNTYKLVRTENLNHYGKLFGGELLKWVDEYVWIAASLDFPATSFVTRAMDNCNFKYGVENGAILRFHIERISVGNTSVRYSADVYASMPEEPGERHIFSTQITLAAIDSAGKKCAVPDPQPNCGSA